MSARPDGGPAFPVAGMMHGEKLGGQLSHGMTLRDYFAAKAMAGLCAHPELGQSSCVRIAQVSYEQADAMLAAREGGAV